MAEESIADKLQREILVSFLEEADEALEDIDAWLIKLEADPSDQDNIGAIFRGIHTIKGNSTFFGLMLVKQLAHQMEDLLDLLRQGKFACQSVHIDGLLAGVDELKAILLRVRGQEDEVTAEGLPGFEALLASILSSIQLGLGQAPPISVRHVGGNSEAQLSGSAESTKQATEECVAQWRTALETLRNISDPKLNKATTKSLEDLLEQLLELAPMSAVESHAAIVSAHSPSVLPTPESSETPKEVSVIPEVPAVPKLQPIVLPSPDVLKAPIVAPPTTTLAAPAAQSSPPPGAPIAPSSSTASKLTSPTKTKTKESASRTMRVDESSIEEFLDYVGELIITREMFGNVGKTLRTEPQLNKLSTEFQRAMTAFTALSHNLQTSIMKIRKVPVKLMLQKAPRIVRDVANKQGKEASVVLEGDEIHVDKTLLETLEDPFVHMMRNAIDHGMEMPDVREAAGKPRKGTITVTVIETDDELLCRIRDNGGGIDAERLKNKAVEGGSLSSAAAQRMSPQEAYQLVFKAGLSTAEKVTEVSGRGVGMDVVKRNILELGGYINIESELGVGTTFTIHLPKAVSVQIFDGFLVRVGNERLVLPLRSVSESFRPLPNQVHTVVEKGECVERRGRILPLLRSGDLLSMSTERRSVSESIVVAITAPGGNVAGLLVDEVLGVQQVVLREIDGLEIAGGVFSGGAVLGDGLVAMVVDVERLSGLHF